MIIDLVIPSKKRKQKLDMCLNSILASIIDRNYDFSINIHLYFSIEEECTHYKTIFAPTHLPIYCYLMTEDYRVPNFWSNHLKLMKADALCYLNDDIEFFPDTLITAYKIFIEKFPDYDGVIGLNQVNIISSCKVEAAFGIVGKKYAERFPDYQVFCPDYNRFYGDFELWQYAKSIHKFEFASPAQIKHHHPCTNSKLADSTHEEVRTWLSKDREIFHKRKERGLLWGKSWELINHNTNITV